MTPNDLSSIFNTYAGATVSEPDFSPLPDLVVIAMEMKAKECGLESVRLIYPGYNTTSEYDDKRLNVAVVKENNAFKIARDGFTIG